MKCPKCGYLGFETTDRCRNCQYDFSLAPFATDPDLALHDTGRKPEPHPDFELPPIKRQSDTLSSNALDLDRLFGKEEPAAREPAPPPPAFARPPVAPVVEESEDLEIALDKPTSAPKVEPAGDRASKLMSELIGAKPAAAPAAKPFDSTSRPFIPAASAPAVPPAPVVPAAPVVPPVVAADEGALPFEDAPMVPPPAARPPLAVRRSTPEVPRNRPRTTRPVRTDLPLEPPKAAPRPGASRQSAETVASLMEMPPLGVRVGAGLIDLLLLVGIDAAVLYLTLRVSGLQNTLEDLRVLPPVPFVGFLALLAFGYVAAFTVAGGQTIGKMMLNLRVIGDDGRPVDAAGGMLRALGCMLVPITLGLSYVPVLVTSDHRALHDRLAGTRVVKE